MRFRRHNPTSTEHSSLDEAVRRRILGTRSEPQPLVSMQSPTALSGISLDPGADHDGAAPTVPSTDATSHSGYRLPPVPAAESSPLAEPAREGRRSNLDETADRPDLDARA